MNRAIETWLIERKSRLNHAGNNDVGLKRSYTIYGCMLLLSSNSFGSTKWQEVRGECSEEDLENLYNLIAKYLKITHIAINRPIPIFHSDGQTENVLRAPSNLTPLHGDFGPTTWSSPPTKEDFSAAFWVTAKQNNIYQTWAPRFTMFSRGNISEKARLLTLPSVLEAVDQGKADGRGCAAVDLYAGIGYFAFSYLKAGVDKVLCWDLNPWSIEGLKRGATANRRSTCIQSNDSGLEGVNDSDASLLVFNESNERASSRVRKLRDRLPPIRHVNCGLLPTSRGSWQTALNVLDREMGGWIHVHENFGIKEIEQKTDEVRATLQQMLDKDGADCVVAVQYVNRLKSYAPGVVHCVLDIYIPPCTAG